MRALLDGDIYAFRSAAASENDDVNIAIWRLEEMIENTLDEVQAGAFSIFLSGDTNFRHTIYPEYKANRTQPKPRHLKALKQYLVEQHNAVVSENCEADDLLGISQCANHKLRGWYGTGIGTADSDVNPLAPETIICSLDKDLRMIPGNHYSFEISGTSKGTKWVKPAERCVVEPFDGLRHFYTQCLTGDAADNVKGASGIGRVKAARILADCTTEAELLEATRSCFSCDEEFLMTGQCLWIFRKPNDIWQFPQFTS
jgi:DNA polymerase-1